MRLHETNYGFESSLPDNARAMQIKTSAKLFDILSSGIYNDPIQAVIRELCCNAYDAHCKAHKEHVPFKLRLPTRLEPQFGVEDEGTGIDPEKIHEIFWTYGESTKTDDQTQIGALGLGSKSPFAYTKSSFVVKNRWNGTEYTHFCFINEAGIPSGSLVDEQPTELKNGVTVEFAVRPDDFEAFQTRAARLFKYWKGTKPTVIAGGFNELKYEETLSGDGWFLEMKDRYGTSPAIAVMGNVAYPVDPKAIPNLPDHLSVIAWNPFVIYCDMGSLSFTASREGLQYSEFTCKNLIARFEEISGDLQKAFAARVFKTGMTQVQFIQNFSDAFSDVTKTFKAGNGNYDRNWYVGLVLGKKSADSVKYGHHSYKIDDLLNRKLVHTHVEHEKFGLTHLTFQRVRVSTNVDSFVEYTRKIGVTTSSDTPSATLVTYGDISRVITPKLKHLLNYSGAHTGPWFPERVTSRVSDPDGIELIMRNRDLFDGATTHTVNVPSKGVLTFVINDCGSSGEARFKAWCRDSDTIYVRHHPDATVSDVVSSIEQLIKEMGLEGAVVKMLSSLPDLRAKIDQEKIESGSVRLKYLTLSDSGRKCSCSGDALGEDLNLPGVTTKLHEKIWKIDELKAMARVAYVIKRRAKDTFYDDAGSQARSIVHSSTVLALSRATKLLTLPENVFVLTESHVNGLSRRGVKLVTFRDELTRSVTDLEAREKFVETVTDVLSYEKISLLPALRKHMDLGSAFKQQVESSNSELCRALSKYRRERTLIDTILRVKYQLYCWLVGTPSRVNKQEVLERIIKQRYPLLKFISPDALDRSQTAQEALNYVELVEENRNASNVFTTAAA